MKPVQPHVDTMGGVGSPPYIYIDQGMSCVYVSAGREFYTPEEAELNVGLPSGTGFFEDLTQMGDSRKRFVLIGK